jgi:asparagine synthase (glutamine-hydrolysing)
MAGSTDPVEDYAKVYFDRRHDEMRRTLDERYIGEDHSLRFIADYLRAAGDGDPIDNILQMDTEIMLVDDPVKRVDNMTMAFGIEARVPFLDHELVELAARIPAPLKLKDGGKYILKEAARKVVPAGVIDRPKGYFPVPALKYIRGPYLDFVRDALSAPQARDRGMLRTDYVDALLSKPDEALTPKGHSKVWQIALLESWFQAHGL